MIGEAVSLQTITKRVFGDEWVWIMSDIGPMVYSDLTKNLDFWPFWGGQIRPPNRTLQSPVGVRHQPVGVNPQTPRQIEHWLLMTDMFFSLSMCSSIGQCHLFGSGLCSTFINDCTNVKICYVIYSRMDVYIHGLRKSEKILGYPKSLTSPQQLQLWVAIVGIKPQFTVF